VYGTGPEADVVYSITADSPTGLQLQLDGRTATFRLAGSFNAANLAAAYSTLLSLDVSPAEGIEALAQAQPAPGRFEPVHTSAGTTAIVDYAHTPDALENVLLAARRLCRGHLWCVFGCGGDRDAKKRPVMARTAERLCDRIVLTSDNPRSEHPGAIIEDMIAGLHRPSGATVHADRASAIQYALGNAGPQDVVVVAGKGHETYQVLSDRTIEFDDRKVIRNAAVEA
jgi:UDP-N-acetylmuramoyl-L-alanyl-D-glutamate--2,6-diaminopimelate ligase